MLLCTLLKIKIASKSSLVKAIDQNKTLFGNDKKKSDYLIIGIDSVCAILHYMHTEKNRTQNIHIHIHSLVCIIHHGCVHKIQGHTFSLHNKKVRQRKDNLHITYK